MKGNTTSRQRTLSEKQLDVLKLLFRFRFGTTDHISQAQGGLSRNSANVRLVALAEKGFISRKREGKDAISGKPAVYSLANAGRKYLANNPDKYSSKVLESIRANPNASEKFVNHHLNVFSIFNILSQRYQSSLVFLTKSNLDVDKFNYLPEVKPDAFLHMTESGSYYFMYVFEGDSPDFAYIRKLSTLFEYEKSGKWEITTGQKLPTVLIVTGSKRLETVLKKRIRLLKENHDSELSFTTTVMDRLKNSDNPWLHEDGSEIWLN